MGSKLTSSHWGVGLVSTENGRITSIEGHPDDPNPSPINQNIAGSLNGTARVLNPAIRKSWLEGNPRAVERGKDPFVEVSWEQALKLIAEDLTRVRSHYGNEAIFAGSYGWSSAGRFHHAQSQLKRFLNTQGGFVASYGNYSYNAALGLMPHIVMDFRTQVAQATRWQVIAKHGELVVLFGGLAERNTQVSDGGIFKHRLNDNLQACADNGVRFINLSPLRSDVTDAVRAEWLPPRPGSDTAVMLAVAFTLYTEGLHDEVFLKRYTTGFEKFLQYLLGESDGVPKTCEWAEAQSGIPASRIKVLAREMAGSRCMINVAAGVQRADFGEQPLWMAVTLAAMLGQIGLPGGGYTVGYGVNGNIGNMERLFRWGNIPQGENRIKQVVPVAMISDMLLNPGAEYTYQGSTHRFPDIKMIWWAGGNPFHHHQDLNRLRKAFQVPETVIVNEFNWTSTARHADIVLPVAASQERNDYGGGRSDDALVPMPAHAQPPGQAKTEYEIFAQLSSLLGNETDFTEGRSETDWLRELWEKTQKNGEEAGVTLPDWETFIKGDVINLPDPSPNQVFLVEFRENPDENPLPTPSGKIEIHSETIAAFGLEDCPGHAIYCEPRDLQAGLQSQYPLYLLSGQPKTRLHSQLDNGAYSVSHKINGREPVLIHPYDAAARNIADGDVVELFNSRGRCLAGAKVTDEIAQGSVFLWTGAWYDPDFDAPDDRDRHGNPNVLTHDLKTSTLTQSPASHSTLIEIKKFEGKLPEVTVHHQPTFVR